MIVLRQSVYFCGLLGVVLLGFCLTSPAYAETPLRYAGATTLQRDFLPEATALFTQKTGIQFVISGGNTDAGLQALQAGTVDFAGAGRALSAAEKAAGLKEHLLAWDPLIFVVHRSNPVGNLTRAQLRGIFDGTIRNWKELGGRDQPVMVVLGPESSGIYATVQQMLLNGKKPLKTALLTPLVADGDQQVAQMPTAICPLSKSMIDQPEVRLLRIDGIEPSSAEVAARRYPLLRPLSLVTPRSPRPAVQHFIDFARGPEGLEILTKNFFPVAAR